MSEVTKLELLELDVDARMAELWNLVSDYVESGQLEDEPLETLGVFMRAAYGKGYTDALEDGGQLCRDNGYRVPKRRRK